MESVGKYRERFPERIGEKLFQPFNKDGELNDELPGAAAYVEGVFEKYPEFIGLTYVGSKALGYSQLGSDIDFAVMHDYTDAKKENVRRFESARRRVDGMKFEGQHEFHLFSVPVVPSEIVRELASGNEYSRAHAGWALAALLGPARGPQVRAYREQIAEALHSLSPADKQKVVDAVVADRTIAFGDRTRKVQERIATAQVPKEILAHPGAARVDLWRKRVIKLLDFDITP